MATAERTILLVVNSRCRYCTDSMPVYRQLLDRRDPATTRVVGVGMEPVQTLRSYFGEHRVEPDRVLQLPAGDSHIRATPTVLAVDRGGTILAALEGLPSSDEDFLSQVLPPTEGDFITGPLMHGAHNQGGSFHVPSLAQ